MSISSLAIFSRRENGKDELLYVKEFRNNHHQQGSSNDDDIDTDLFQSILLAEENEYSNTNNPGSYEANRQDDCSVRHQFLLQSGLEKMNEDVKFENQLRTTFDRQFVGNDYMWIGFICPIDEYRLYGYVTNTNVKIIVAVEDDILSEQEDLQKMRDTEIRKIFKRIHQYYVDYLQNPFASKRGKIKSRRFTERMQQISFFREI
mmetsp:Transcript_19148/g.28682  ORF Transcript_19148/g.28682 Transcript_19148/m.28682 type:complete len:204 (+) Transcript_19148:128-739(+)